MIELILGGIKSGKSRLAEKRAIASQLDVVYIATAQTQLNGEIDAEMQQRVEHHRSSRPAHWQTIEEPIKLADLILANNQQDKCVLVDCLTLWLTNLLIDDDTELVTREIGKLLQCLDRIEAHLIFVSNETSMGIIPDSALTRKFCDQAGLVHQAIAGHCDNVVLTVAGLPHVLKGR